MKKKIGVLLIGLLLILGLAGCGANVNSSDSQQAQQTEQIQKQSQSKLGLPNIKNFYEKETLKSIMEQADNSNLITYAYLQNKATGKFVYLGQAMGYGIPYGTEYTNPNYIAKSYQGGYAILPQPDPNGLYKAQGVNATWLMLIDPVTKKASPIYVEPEMVVSQFKLPRNLVDPSTIPSDY